MFRHKEVDHTAEDHIVERVHPHGCQKEEELRGRGEAGILLVPRTCYSKGEADELPRGTHDDNPTEPDSLVEDSLEDMGEGSDAEDDGENKSTSERRVIAIIGITSPFWDISILSGCDIDASRTRCRSSGGR